MNIIIILIRLKHADCTWLKSGSPFLFAFGQGPILVWINQQHNQAQPYGICTCLIYLTQTHHMWSITQRSRTIFKVFGMTPTWVDYNPRPPKLKADALPQHYRVGITHIITNYNAES
jgi:hypothetical protein